MLKRRIKKLEDVDEKYRPLYEQDGDEFVLTAEIEEDASASEIKAKLDEFRTTNRTLKTEKERLEKLLKQFDGIDPDTLANLKKAQEETQVAEEQKLIKQGKLDEVVTRRTAAREAEFLKQLKQVNETLAEKDRKLATYSQRLASLTVDQELEKTIEGVGVKPRPGALDDLRRRTRDVWKMDPETGEMQAVGPDGKPLYSAEKAGEPLTMKEYVAKNLLTSAGHLFEAATGGGATGSKGTTSGSQRVIPGNDPVAMGRAVKDIASGKARVQIPQQG